MTHSMEPSGFRSERSPTQGAWHWKLLDDSGGEVDARGVTPPSGAAFSSQADAESWVGEVWRDLVEAGVDAVTLMEGDREVYGPMSLHPES